MVEKSYKQTDIGVIPKDWDVKSLGKIAEIRKGRSLSKNKLNQNGKFKCLLYGELFTTYKEVIKDVTSKTNCNEGVKSKKGDLLFPGSTTTSGIDLAKASAILCEGVLLGGDVIIVRKKFDYNSIFLSYFLNKIKRFEIASKTKGITIHHLYGSDLQEIEINLPPKPEQKAIAEVLSDVNAWIESLNALITKKQHIKQGSMQILLHPYANDKLKHGWVTKKLAKISDITGAGVDKKINPAETQIMLLNYMDVYKRNYLYKDELKHKVTTSFNKIKSCNIKKWDIFLTPSSEIREDIGISAIAMEDLHGAVYSYHINRLRYKTDIYGLYGLYMLKTHNFLHQSKTLCDGSGTRYVISLKNFREMSVFFPKDIKEQQKIAQVLSDMDKEITALQTKLKKARQIKQAMMQELLTGKIRLISSIPQETQILQLAKPRHNEHFENAVIIAVLADIFGSQQYPLGRKRYTKLSYLLHRYAQQSVENYFKKAAGPYNPKTKYGGAEQITQNKNYAVYTVKSKYRGFIAGSEIEKAKNYFIQWFGYDSLNWLEQFRTISNDKLELLTTVDNALLDLRENNQEETVLNVKQILLSNKEWQAKLKKKLFSDSNIKFSIRKSQELFGVTA